MVTQILSIIDKFIPDKTKSEELKKEIAELDYEMEKIKQPLYLKVIPLVFPFATISLIAVFILDALTQWSCGIIGREVPIIVINEYWFIIVETFLVSLFGKKTIEKFKK